MKIMNRILLFVGFIAIATSSCAQTPNKSKAALGVPPYKILNTDSAYVTPADLKKNAPVMIIYFSPDCSHCQHLMYELKPKMKDFKNVQVVMVTFVLQLKAIQVFYRDFDLKRYPNFTVGTEGETYLVQRYFDVHTTPYIALYDKNHKLVKAWEKAPSVDELADEAKKL
jgi:thioredoxin-related protein